MASTESMLGQGSRQLDGREVTEVFQANLQTRCPLLSWPSSVLESRLPLCWLPTLSSVGNVSCLAGLLLRDRNSGDWEGP